MKFVRFLSAADQTICSDTYESLRRRRADELARGEAGRSVFWLNLFARGERGDFTEHGLEPAVYDRIFALLSGLRAEVFPEGVLVSCGLTVNPRGTVAQLPHVDYGQGYGGLYVPVTPVEFGNTIVTFHPPLPQVSPAEADAARYGYSEEQLLEQYGYVQKTFTASRPFAVWQLDYDIVHGAVANTTDVARAMFYVVVHRQGAAIHEGAAIFYQPR